MENAKPTPMQSGSGREPTAFTMKAIKDLLAEDQTAPAEAVTLRTPLPRNHVQQPPHMRGTVPAPKAGRPALKASAAHHVAADVTAPPMPLPRAGQNETAPSRIRTLFGRLTSG